MKTHINWNGRSHSVLLPGAAVGGVPRPGECRDPRRPTQQVAGSHAGASGSRVPVRPDPACWCGAVVDLGPDHYARLTAVSRLLQVLAAGRPIAKAAEVKRRHIDVGD